MLSDHVTEQGLLAEQGPLTEPGPLVIQSHGTFDLSEAERVAHALEGATAGQEVRIDLSHVRDFHDFGVAVLGRALARRHAAVRGLRMHQIRMLKYLGIDAGAVPQT